VLDDLRHALRVWANRPGFAALVVVILALGIGANAALFSVLNAVVLRPFPYVAPERLYELAAQRKGHELSLTAADFMAWRARSRVFERMAAARQQAFTLTGVDEPEQLLGLGISSDCLAMLGTRPLLGRIFGPDDFRPGALPVVLLGAGLWNRRFGGDPNTLGRQVLLDGQARTVVGVMPASFRFHHRRHEVWVPLAFTTQQLNRLDLTSFMAFGRLKPGVGRQQADMEAEEVSRMVTQELPRTHAGWRATVKPLLEEAVAEPRPAMLALLGAVGLVLLTACLNVANLLQARAAERAREMAVRRALGAGRGRLVRQLLTESVLLALAGGTLGLLLAGWGVRALIAAFPGRIPVPRLDQSSIDGYVLGFTLLVSIASGVAFGLAPVWQAWRTELSEALKQGGPRAGCGLGAERFRGTLVAFEMALALVLLAGAGLMLRSFARLVEVDPGFQAERVLTVDLPLPGFRIPERERRPAYYGEILREVQALPGVQAAALTSVLPLSGGEVMVAFASSYEAAQRGERSFVAPYREVSPDYFRVMGIPVVRGRGFTEADTVKAPRVAVVNEAMARRYWPGENPIGKSLPVGGSLPVVGVVGNVKHRSLSAEPVPELYQCYLQGLGNPYASLVIRTSANPSALASAVRRRIRELRPEQPVGEVKTLREVVAGSLTTPRFHTLLLGLFAGLAMALAIAGVYGVMSYTVSRRTQEIGIRMALGAAPGRVIRLVIWQGIRWTLLGVAVGLVGAMATTRLISTLLFGVSPTDAATLILVALLLAVAALAACYVPARRAARAEPVTALRHE